MTEIISDTTESGTAMKPSTRGALLVILAIAAVMAVVLVWIYLVEGSKYISTDNAQIDGDKIALNAPDSGTLTDWTATQGTPLAAGQVVGRVQIPAGFAQPQRPIKAPGDGTVVIDNGVEGSFVAVGTPLAIAYDLSKIFVTARVEETDIDDVHVGQRVDIDVDAFPDAELTGSVIEVQGGAAGEFSPLPQSNTAGNFQKVTQVIPVKIALSNVHALPLVPGMNATVKIHKDS